MNDKCAKESRVVSHIKKLFLGYEITVKPKGLYKEFSENIYIKTDDNENIGAFLIKPKIINQETEFFIFCHGKGCDRIVLYKSGIFTRLINLYNVCFLIIDYRGFGDSTGEYTIQGVNLDVLAAYKFLKKTYNCKSISLVGHSLGCGVALEYGKFAMISKKFIPKKIFCLAPFISSIEICKDFKTIFSVFSFFIQNLSSIIENNINYDNVENAKFTKDILYIFHGNEDKLINIRHGRRIADEVGCKFIETSNNHINIFVDERVWEVIIEISSKI